MTEAESVALSVRELVASLQPGEVLRFDDDGVSFYERVSRWGLCIERLYLDGDLFTETVSSLVRPEIEAQVSRGELVYGPACSEWHRPSV